MKSQNPQETQEFQELPESPAATNSFDQLNLSPQMARAVQDLGYETATGIQAQSIPLLLAGQDIIGRSSTGTGKTAAFGIPAVELVDGNIKQPQILVLSPTRELALQISGQMQHYAKYKEGVCVATVYGGASMSDQIRLLRRANVVVGTPGRLMDHLRRRTLKMDALRMVVLDEADEMLSMGFIEDIQTILSQAPDERQTVLFSATMPPSVLKISQEFLTDPQLVEVAAQGNNQADIEQTYYYVPQQRKQEALLLLLRYADAGRSIVFCNTKTMVDELALLLSKEGLAAAGIHGDMTQAARTQVMQAFRDGRTRVLVATDVAARGIDVSGVDAVINFDLPQSFEYYVHRIGRTGRAGEQGVSQTLVCGGRQMETLRALMRFTGNPIREHRLPTGGDMLERAVAKEAVRLMPQLQETPGKAARLLVQRLMGASDSGITGEQVAQVLAEALLGGDENFQSSQELEEFSHRKGTQENRDGRLQRLDKGAGRGSSMVMVTADIGRSSRVLPNHLVGMLSELVEIPRRQIGKIQIEEDETTIALRAEDAEALLNYGRPIRIKGTQVNFRLEKKAHRSPDAFTPRSQSRRGPKPGGHSGGHSGSHSGSKFGGHSGQSGPKPGRRKPRSHD